MSNQALPRRSDAENAAVDGGAPRRNAYAAFALRAGLGGAVVAVMVWHFDARPIFHALGRERLSYFAAAIALYLAGQVMSAWRWQLLARLNSIAGPFREYVAYYFVGVFTNLFVPGLVGGDAARALYLGKRHDRVSLAVASVIADRGFGLLALFWFAAAAVLTIREVALPPAIVRVIVAIGAVTLIGWLVSPLIGRFVGFGRGRLARAADPILPYLRRPIAIIPAFILSCALQASLAICQNLLARGLGLDTPPSVFMLCVPIANVFASIPLTLNGLGLRETAYLVLFGYAGLSRPDAIALGLLMFAMTMIGGLSGVVAFVATKMPAPDRQIGAPEDFADAPGAVGENSVGG